VKYEDAVARREQAAGEPGAVTFYSRQLQGVRAISY
jgi:hypothetical protein